MAGMPSVQCDASTHGVSSCNLEPGDRTSADDAVSGLLRMYRDSEWLQPQHRLEPLMQGVLALLTLRSCTICCCF